nr:uncharacterized protein LOC127312494 isoform X3 [Lolium perenne]
MHPPPAAAAVVAPPAAAGGAAAAGRPAGRWWQPYVCRGALARAQLVIAAAAAAFAIFASTLRPADFPYVPAQCVTTAAEVLELRYYAGLLLRCAMAQAGAAAAALVITPPSTLKGCLAGFANLLGLVTLTHLLDVVRRVLAATGGSCFTGHFRTVEYIFHVITADAFLLAIPLIWFFGQ